jgi:antitoxin ParD1/3/4
LDGKIDLYHKLTQTFFCGMDKGMPIRVSLNVSLTPELEQFVESRVASGRYQTASEVIREGLRLLEEREQTREAALEELRAQLRRGVEQADRGELLDGDAVFEEIRQLSARAPGGKR